jgi:hypothetical protein
VAGLPLTEWRRLIAPLTADGFKAATINKCRSGGRAVAGSHRGAGAPLSLCEAVVLLDANQIALPDGSDGL